MKKINFKGVFLDIFQDWNSNKGNIKARIILILFRIANAASTLKSPYWYVAVPYLIFYRIFIEWILGIELPWKLKVGAGLRLFHGQGLVINDNVVIGKNCILRHCTTIGVAHTSNEYVGLTPRIGDNVDIGSNVVIIGDICIGSGSKIGAGSVVIRDVPPGAVVVGNPARIINKTIYGSK